MNDDEIELQIRPVPRSTRVLVVATRAGHEIHRDKVDLDDAAARRRLAACIMGRAFPGVRDDWPAGRLEQLEQTLARRAAVPVGPGCPIPAPAGGEEEAVGPYLEREGQLCRRFFQKEGAEQIIPLANFAARVVYETTRDDGVERRLHFTLEGTVGPRLLPPVDVKAEEFTGMGWVSAKWGAGAVVYAGNGTKDHLRAAIQLLSSPSARTVYTHTGWREVDGKWVYLHGGGAIGADGPVAGLEVELPAAMARYVLPDPSDVQAVRAAVRASLGLLDRLAPDAVVMPLLAAAYRAPLGACDFGVHLFGETGTFKSELAALVQQHYGAGMTARNLPANWSSTANANEQLAFAAKDALMVVDDFNPTGAVDPAKLHQAADRLFRAAGNAAGRGRLTQEATLRETKPPRALVLATGEDLPRGHSVLARLAIVECDKGAVDQARLTAAQKEGAAGTYALALAGYVRWLAPRLDAVRDALDAERAAVRREFMADAAHARSASSAADLYVGLVVALRFAVQTAAVTAAEAADLLYRAKKVFLAHADGGDGHMQAENPVERFLDLLRAVLMGGHAHVTSLRGGEPGSNQGLLGWSKRSDMGKEEWAAGGRRIGYTDGETLFLLPDATYAEIQRLASTTRHPFNMGDRSLWRHLSEDGHLAAIEEHGGKRRFTRRISIDGRQVPVVHLRFASFSSHSTADDPDPAAIPV